MIQRLLLQAYLGCKDSIEICLRCMLEFIYQLFGLTIKCGVVTYRKTDLGSVQRSA